jgi:hypothetical protein
MARLEITEKQLVLHMSFLDSFLSLRGSLTVPLEHVIRAEARPTIEIPGDPYQDHFWGTYVPERVLAGSWRSPHGEVFYDVRDPSRAVGIELSAEHFQQVVVELGDEAPEDAVERIEQALADRIEGVSRPRSPG